MKSSVKKGAGIGILAALVLGLGWRVLQASEPDLAAEASIGHSDRGARECSSPTKRGGAELAGRSGKIPDAVSVFISGGLPATNSLAPQFMELALPTGEGMRICFTDYSISSSGAINWIGQIEEDAESFFSLTVVDDVVEGHTLSERGEFLLTGNLSGRLSVEEVIVPNPFCQTCRALHDRTGAYGNEYTEFSVAPQAEAAAAGAEVDLLVVYTPLALEHAGSLSALLAKANQMVNSLNNICSSSGADSRVNLLGIAPVSHPGALATSDGSVQTLYSRLKNASDGQLDEAQAYRTAYGADMVCVFGKATNYGVASIGGPWSAADYSTAHGVMPHELGHNLGCGHNDVAGSGQTYLKGVYSYSFGHYFNYGGEQRGTMMSYVGRRMTRFSSPERTWNGVVTGTATRDHARTIKTFAPTAAAWRTSNPDDYDQDGRPNSIESASADEDGDGLPDNLDPDQAPEGPSSGMVAHWPFDEGSGTVATDASGHDHTGTLLNGATWGSDAVRASYVVLDGADDRVATTFNYALADTNNFTWAWWAKKEPTSHSDSIMVGNRYPERVSPKFGFIKMTPQGAQFANTSEAGQIERYDYADIPESEWHHFAMVKSETSYQWYVDGQAQGVASNFSYNETSPLPFLIGGDGNGKPNEHFEGGIDDVVLYREALTSGEVVGLKNGIYPFAPVVYEVIAGWDTWDDAAAPSAPVLAAHVAGSAVTASEGNVWHTDDERGASNDGTWGGFSGSPAASTVVAMGECMELSNATTGGTMTFTITNNGTADIVLGGFHFDALAFRSRAARTYTLSVLAGGGITPGVVHASGAQAITSVGSEPTSYDLHDEFDHDVSGLADHTLGSGESVQFLLSFSGGAGDGSGGHDLWVDNVGVSGVLSAPVPPTEAPVLEHEMSSAGVVFSWIGNGFKVQSRTNLMEGGWLDVPSGAVPPVSVLPTNGAAFYRLIGQ